ncbi:alpha/beta hydrolase [Streptomyces sp. NBC_00237]|uniref:alpha/beta fold hydrolase n=1 Tax=Streptomyces sp. NBC_00237 TaxID=2975687 RepID=UPI00225664F0|nr:alpha/beta fold hydrolase [Streptomyces sp. NBC_00237]MCX5200192.1 alpha/beta hydrolase [Streptomyces sp. NBC_00237]
MVRGEEGTSTAARARGPYGRGPRRRATRRHYPFGRAAALLALALFLAACGGGGGDGNGPDGGRTASATPAPPTPAADWKDCPLTGQPTRECTALKVPVDAAKPGSGTLELAVSRLPATDKRRRIGALVMDPGGPGLPGLYTTASLLPPQIRALFDVVGYDRRGSGKSRPVDCGEPGGALAKLGEGDFADLEKAQADPAAIERSAKEYAATCRTKYGELTAHLGTKDTTADIESIRLALGEDKLSLLMVSYGTLVAQDYLRTHPEHVRAAVLDGTVDPAQSGPQAALESSATLEEASGTAGKTEQEKAAAQLRSQSAGFRSWCTASGPAECAVAPQPEEALTAVAAKTGDLAKAVTAVMVVPSDWPGFSRAVEKAQDAAPGDPAAYADLKAYADKGFPKDVAAALKNPGTSTAFDIGVKCADYVWPKTTAGVLKELAETAEKTGEEDSAPFYASLYATCPSWPHSSAPLAPLSAKNAPRPLVVNAEHDVRTTLAEAETVAKNLPAALLKVGGQTHGVVQSGNTCVDAAVLKVLVDGERPKDGTCPEF